MIGDYICERCGVSFKRRHDRPHRFCNRACWYATPRQHSAETRRKQSLARGGTGFSRRDRPKKGMRRGVTHQGWKGGGWVNRGRVYVLIDPADRQRFVPHIRPDGYMRRAQYIWLLAHPSETIQRGEVIHHRNEIKDDDHPENLQKMTQGEHFAHHIRTKIVREGRHHSKGKRLSPEHRAKISAANIRRHAADPELARRTTLNRKRANGRFA